MPVILRSGSDRRIWF